MNSNTINTKLLSVVIPSYNIEKYISESIRSFLGCRNIGKLDLIIVDDGSTDSTGIIIRQYEDCPSIRIVTKPNGGHGSAVNTGMDQAEGKYFVIVDGDDWVDAKKLDDFLDDLEHIDSDIVITGHYNNFINDGSERKFVYREKRGKQTDVGYLLNHHYRIPMADLCYKTSFLRKTGLRLQEKIFYVDEEFCSIPFLWARTVTFYSEGFYHYRVGDVNQSISEGNVIRRIDQKERILFRLIKEKTDDAMPDNYQYFSYKLEGIANSVMYVYFMLFPDRNTGRKRGQEFFGKLRKEDQELSARCLRAYRIFKAFSYLHVNKNMWDRCQNIKNRLQRL